MIEEGVGRSEIGGWDGMCKERTGEGTMCNRDHLVFGERPPVLSHSRAVDSCSACPPSVGAPLRPSDPARPARLGRRRGSVKVNGNGQVTISNRVTLHGYNIYNSSS